MPCPPPGSLPNPGIKLRSPTLQANSVPSEPPGKPKNTGVGSLSLLQGNFLTQESNQGLLHCRQILYQLSHRRRPRILEWVAYPFSSGSSQPRNGTRVSCIAEDSLPTELFRKGPGCEDAIANPRLKRAYVLNLFYLISSKYHICQNS